MTRKTCLNWLIIRRSSAASQSVRRCPGRPHPRQPPWQSSERWAWQAGADIIAGLCPERPSAGVPAAEEPCRARRRPRHRPRRRRRRAALPADEGARQAGRLLRRAVPHHRFHAQQLHQLRAAPDLHRHAVQVALAQPPHPHGLERRVRGARRVHRDPAAAEARRRALVPGHGRRGLPEPLLDHAREPAPPDRAVGRPRLQDGLRADAAVPPGARRRRVTLAAIEVPVAEAHRFGIVAVDDDERRDRLPGEAAQPTPIPGSPDFALASMGIYIFDTDVLVPRARSRRARSRRATTSARTSSRR